MPPTLREIAHQLGMSVTTVSNVLRGTGRFSDETRIKVLEAVRESGYQMKTEVSSPGRFLGLLYCLPPVPGRERTVTSALPGTATDFTTGAVEGIDQVLSSEGYHLLFRFVGETDSENDIPDMVLEKTVQGVLVVGGSVSDRYIKAINDTNMPMVVLFTQLEPLMVDCVLADNTGGAYLATKHLIDLGHRCIGLINGWAATRTSAQKLQGYKQALEEANLSYNVDWVCAGQFTYESGYLEGKRLLSLPNRPTAIFVADDTMAMGAMKAARELQLSVPKDVSFVGFGDHPFSVHTEPPLTTVRVAKREIGELAAKRLLEVLHEPHTRPLQITVATELVLRESTAPLQQ